MSKGLLRTATPETERQEMEGRRRGMMQVFEERLREVY
jgi:hypothetical protein